MNLIEIIGWIGTVLIVGAYFLNINGKVKSTAVPYILANIIGGICFPFIRMHTKPGPIW